ncbi:hypothetical protein [Actinokineospora enzanensis]|uniref:hypothetical protein n=1 Tax=Actinokineospora enzanensis TaxID=155975 RepID=UPI000364465E|nr:hypothetical protein [Actinokineospora enzanensis]
MITVAGLVADLKRLRHGTGLHADELPGRISDSLREVFDLPQDECRVRAALRKAITDIAGTMQDDRRLAVQYAFGLLDDSGSSLLTERKVRLAKRIERDPRTATRRMDGAIRVLAENALARHTHTPEPDDSTAPWRTTALETSVVLDSGVPEIYERRRITTRGDRLDEVELQFTAGRGPRVEVVHGGTLGLPRRHSRTRTGYVLSLPRPLDAHAEHEFMLRLRFDDPGAFEPYYVCTPQFPCRSFDLHLRFGPVPAEVWRIEGVPVNEVLDHSAPRDRVAVDSAGEVHMSFQDLRGNLSCGAVWSV